MLKHIAVLTAITLNLWCSQECLATTETLAALTVEKDLKTSTAAADLVTSALSTAKAESKNVFLLSGFPECSWCQLFDRYHAAPEVAQIVKKYYVIGKIDTENMPDGNTIFEKYAEPGAPAWVILDPSGKVLMTSYDEKDGNVGYPYKPNEAAHYVKALNATSEILEPELNILRERLLRTASKKTAADNP